MLDLHTIAPPSRRRVPLLLPIDTHTERERERDRKKEKEGSEKDEFDLSFEISKYN